MTQTEIAHLIIPVNVGYQQIDDKLYRWRQYMRQSGFGPLEYYPPPVIRVAFSQRSSSPSLIEDEAFKDRGIINNLIDYEDGQVELDSSRADKNMQRSSFPTKWKSIFLK
ncbi:hypothetical protein TNCV_1595451 [Trichonephila clavipes]|nr:hypothetical protein TNCV_1595451 [Trichonephila clavipes]